MMPAAEQSPTPYQLLPRLSDDEYASLKADVAENGIRVPIDVDEIGVVLDGHHRSWIAADLGIECPRRVVVGLSDEQKRAHAIATNIYRRQLSRDARRELIGRLREQGMSTRQIAEVAQVHHATVARDLDVVRPVADATPHTAAPIKGSDGKVYQPQTVAQRRDLAQQLRAEGLSVQQIGDHMGIAKGTAQSLLAPSISTRSDGSRVVADAAAVSERVRRARELAGSGASSAQIAAEFGMSEAGVKNLCKREGIEVRADRILSRTRRLDSNRIVEQTVRATEVPESLLAAVDYGSLDRALLGEWISSLSESIRALGSLKRQLEKELSR